MPEIVYIGNGNPLSEATQQISSLEEALKHLQQAPANEIYVVNPHLPAGANLPEGIESALSEARYNFGNALAPSVVVLNILSQMGCQSVIVVYEELPDSFKGLCINFGYTFYDPFDHGRSLREMIEK